MILWCNEASSPESASNTPPPVPVQILRVEERGRNWNIWFAPVPAIPAGDVMPDPVGMLTARAGMHHEWFEAWQEAGFSEDQAYGLVTEVVRSAFSQ